MKFFILGLLFMSATASVLANEYIVVSVSGFRTIRERTDRLNVLSNKIDSKGEDSGVWSNAPTKQDNKKILETAYLTHFSKQDELDETLKLFEDKDGLCKNNLDLILIANSWGAKISQKFAKEFYAKCGKKPIITYLLEGISKPTYFSYTEELFTEECINIYQSKSSLHGNSISNCKNFEFTFPTRNHSMFNTHITAEWEGGDAIKRSILNYVKNNQNGFNIDVQNYAYYGLMEQ